MSVGPSHGPYENHRGSLTLTLLNVLGVLGVLIVLNVLNVLNIYICPWTHRWPAEPCYLHQHRVPLCFVTSIKGRNGGAVNAVGGFINNHY